MDWEVVIAAPLVGAWKGYSGMRRTERKNILEFPDISNVGAELEIERTIFHIQLKRKRYVSAKLFLIRFTLMLYLFQV